jgi:hypothetical protein
MMILLRQSTHHTLPRSPGTTSGDGAKEIIEQIADLRIELEEAQRLSAMVAEEKAALFEKEAE